MPACAIALEIVSAPASTPRILAAVIARYRAQVFDFVTIP